MGVDTQEIKGFDELAAKLRAIAPTLRKQALRNALAAGGRLVRDEARRNTPILARPTSYRTPGLVRKAFSVRTSKEARRAGNVGVFVNVRRATAGSLGAKSRLDPYYWRFLEFGTRHMPARGMLQSGAKKLPEALRVFQAAIGKWFKRAEASGKVVP